MSRKQCSFAICSARPDRTATAPLLVAPCHRLRTVDRVVLVVSAIEASGYLECTERDFAARHIVRLVRSHRPADYHPMAFQRATQHLAIPGDMSTVDIARLHREVRTDRTQPRLLAAAAEWYRVEEHTAVAMGHSVPSPNDAVSRSLTTLLRTPFALPEANEVALRRLPPAWRFWMGRSE